MEVRYILITDVIRQLSSGSSGHEHRLGSGSRQLAGRGYDLQGGDAKEIPHVPQLQGSVSAGEYGSFVVS